MLINLLWDEPKAGSFAVITTTNITLQDIEKKQTFESVNADLFFPFERGEKSALRG